MLDGIDVARRLPAPRTARVGAFEQLPKWLNLIPMVAQWIWLGLRYRSVTLPSVVNPHITSGGLVGDGKLEYFASMGAIARAATADFIGVRVDGDTTTADLLQQMGRAGLEFPVVAKPDLGWCGYGVRRIADRAAMLRYLQTYPRGQTLILQRYLPQEGEAGLFYVRDPRQTEGRLIGILLRHYPCVTGNGRDTVAALIADDPRLKRAIGNKLHECRYNAAHIPRHGEKVRLSTIASTRVGGRYEDATDRATLALTRRVDDIARDMREFHVGRFDVRYATLDELLRGEFAIMEVNGAGSEAVHAWDPKYSIAEVYRMVFAKQRLLFEIAHVQRRAGHRPIGIRRLALLHLAQQRCMRLYPHSN